MQYGICSLSIVPVYETADGNSGLLTQLLYGELFKVLESRKHWSRIRTQLDGTEGWIHNRQLHSISETQYGELEEPSSKGCAADLISHIITREGIMQPVPVGSSISGAAVLSHQHEGDVFPEDAPRESLIDTALLYLGSPELKGGRSPFGIDASGLSQMVYKTQGILLKRDPESQARQGAPLSFIEESEPGDLAFFDGPDGIINHVGIIMKDNYIIHCHGKVRIDRLDHTGIFNGELRNYTHPLRVIVKIL
ncbi:MAG: NlpC/P60 family protein [Robiginitalea sp.]|jgi:cell wall-associated NlpC family hydrolase